MRLLTLSFPYPDDKASFLEWWNSSGRVDLVKWMMTKDTDIDIVKYNSGNMTIVFKTQEDQ